MRSRLAHERPDHGIVGEEFGVSGASDATSRWIVDPIDGTRNYVRGIPVWATLIALQHEGRVELGVVSAPALGRRWWAARGHGAFVNGKVMRVSRVATLADAVVSESLGYRLAGRCWHHRDLGDFWQHVLVAEGSVDVATEPEVSLWDLAPLQVIVEEAGGRFTDLAGNATVEGGSVLSTNGLLHEAALSFLSP